ncbi:MAG TPA: NifB/NifX family molybdenum-iron cluster-binding protein [Thermotogota bacterium]|nr:NifB/NifX family molybdenum-iron cluster-binding protein [Thermotogota bacterium]
MKVMVTAEGGTTEALVCNRLARAPFFLIYDTQAQQWTSFQNPYQQEHGMGARIAQFASEKGVEVILGAAPGPNAKAALDTMGIRVAVSAGVTAQEALSNYLAGNV